MIMRLAQPADAGGIARVHVESWRTTYAGTIPADFLAGCSGADYSAILTHCTLVSTM
ncbi:MAG: hypothetical protein HYR94_23215 [Chloroflexi bacterium]|nr:hypothetical protein [Chloroflexota bacterium]